mmetsp:Transcript_14829/g.31671  ORF Transcript_14829/g.31671 Transcript_14829/m.31671 type:complete len:173 (-) Transcript_14829:230-748(-)
MLATFESANPVENTKCGGHFMHERSESKDPISPGAGSCGNCTADHESDSLKSRASDCPRCDFELPEIQDHRSDFASSDTGDAPSSETFQTLHIKYFCGASLREPGLALSLSETSENHFSSRGSSRAKYNLEIGETLSSPRSNCQRSDIAVNMSILDSLLDIVQGGYDAPLVS